MRICAVIKYPPIQGGVSAHGYWLVRSLAMRGHQVFVVTNADEVEPDHRLWIPEADRPLLGGQFAGGESVTCRARRGWRRRSRPPAYGTSTLPPTTPTRHLGSPWTSPTRWCGGSGRRATYHRGRSR